MKNVKIRVPYGKFRMPDKCYACKGTGLDVCPMCNGNKTFTGEPCPACNGKGIVKCYACGGRGIVS